MKKLVKMVLVLFVSILPVATAWGGDLSKSDREQIKDALSSGTLYLRVDAPCATGRHAFGVYKRPLVEVSPEGANTEDTDLTINASWWHADSTYWGIQVNDPTRLDEVDFEDDGIDVELEGVGPADGNATVIKLVDIHSMEDFEAAFDHAFARQPLQEEHDDWSAEIKDAISERRLVDGMTKRQVFYVTGTPKSFQKKEEDGKQVEIWHLRQNKGMKMGYFKAKMGETTGLPETVRFEDGQLVDAAASGTSSDFSLDDQ